MCARLAYAPPGDGATCSGCVLRVGRPAGDEGGGGRGGGGYYIYISSTSPIKNIDG